MPPGMGGAPRGGPHNKGARFVKGAKPKNALVTIKRILTYLSGAHKFALAIVFLCIVFSALAGVLGSMFLQVLIDDYITPLIGSANPDFTPLLTAILIMAGIYLTGVLSSLIYSRIMVVIAHKVLKTVRDEMFEKMQSLPVKYFDTHSFGDTMSCYTNDTDTLRQLLAQSVPQAFSSILTIVTVFAAMLYTSWLLTILICATLLVMFVLIKKIGGASARYFVLQQKSLGKTNGFIEEMINGQKVIKVFSREEQVKSEFDVLNAELCENATKANIYANIFMPVMANIGNIQFVLVAVFGGVLAVFGIAGTTLGAIAAFLQLSRSFSMPVTQVSQQINAVVTALAGAERIFALMDELNESDGGDITLAETGGKFFWKCGESSREVKGDVWFDHVSFSYVEGKEVLHDVSFYAKPGEKVALVGSTGAGKTTITNLINRFYDIEKGSIFYDTQDVKSIRKSDLRRSMGFVLQDVHLFSGSIMDNIRFGRLDASDEEVIEAARLANADEFIRMLPEGYNTVIDGSGGSLSQGQRQLLSIARAAVANPPVMILDEATSSIDTRTEALVQKGMDSLMAGRTVFVIAHRLSTVRNADAILVIEGGRIIERGTHESLIAGKGRYYQLYTGAFELE
ncbi:MAG TPA: ABC transporter ATP-binding protein [Methanocorpusculum sp.]|nr:ABC transporter ATP-binding protein [Methanocorpusculum sp.]